MRSKSVYVRRTCALVDENSGITGTSEHSGNIEWTFGGHSVNSVNSMSTECSNTQWTLNEHWVNIEWTYTVNIECTLSEHTIAIEWTLSEYAVIIQWTLSKRTVDIQLTYNWHTVNIEGTLSAHWANIRSTLSKHSITWRCWLWSPRTGSALGCDYTNLRAAAVLSNVWFVAGQCVINLLHLMFDVRAVKRFNVKQRNGKGKSRKGNGNHKVNKKPPNPNRSCGTKGSCTYSYIHYIVHL
jgi:hypothetical protein